jgi:hypothetical protein
MEFWPRNEYPSPYNLNDLFEDVLKYLAKHPKAPKTQVHKHCVALYGACSYCHVEAVWPLVKQYLKPYQEKNLPIPKDSF